MPLYSYKAVKPDGEMQEGEIEAHDEATLIRLLQAQGLIPLHTRPAGGAMLRRLFGNHRKPALTATGLGMLTRQLATLMEAGLTLDRALQTLIDLTDDEPLKAMLERIQERVRGGATFSAVIEEQGEPFDRLYINMIRAGEASGALDQVLVRLADYLDSAAELRENIKSAMVYPLILVGVAILSVVLLLVFVVPQFEQLFADMGGKLPLPTQIVLAVGHSFRDYWWAMLAGIATIAVLGQYWLAQPAVRQRWDRQLLKWPLFGDLILKFETARFCRTLATLMDNGLTLLSALHLSKEVVGNSRIAAALDASAEDLKRGKGLAAPLARQEVFAKLALQMIQVGEESGHLEPMLNKLADIYDRETRASIKRLLTLLEPVLIIGLGVMVAGIIMSILVAILAANELVF